MAKFANDDRVYDVNKKNADGKPTYQKFWISAIKTNSESLTHSYQLKDAPGSDGKTIGWVEEKNLKVSM